jgi:hypothetical protein
LQESGDFTPSFLSYSLEGLDKNHDLAYQEEVVKNVAGTMYQGIHFSIFTHQFYANLVVAIPCSAGSDTVCFNYIHS